MFTEKDMTKTRTRLLLKEPFFGSLATRLKYEATYSIKTLSVDGVTMKYNPSFMEALPELERQGVIVHEIAHCALLHMYRRSGRDPREWNIACDYAINPMVIKSGLRLPVKPVTTANGDTFSGVLLDSKYEGWTAERIYGFRKNEQQKEKEEEKKAAEEKADAGKPKQEKADGDGAEEKGDEGGAEEKSEGEKADGAGAEDKKPGGDSDEGSGEKGETSGGDSDGTPGEQTEESAAGSGNGEPGSSDGGGESQADGPGTGRDPLTGSCTGDFEDGPEDAEGAVPGAMNSEDWKIAVEQSARVAQMAGSMPGGWMEEIKASRDTGTDWKAILEQFVVRTVQSDYSWSTPARRLISRGLYVPGIMKENVGEIVIGIDTSGSVSSEMLNDFASEVKSILATVQPERVHVVYCDTQVNHVDTVEPADYGDLKFAAVGRGGTRFQPVLDWIEEQDIKPVCLIYQTDLYGAAPVEPDYPVIWVTPAYNGITEGPFGTTVQMVAEESR